MDTETVDAADFAACLADLARVNTVTLAWRPTLDFMRRAAGRAGAAPLRVLDVGCGGGDMLRRIHRWAGATGVDVALTGVDLNPLAIAAARTATPAGVPITWHVADALDPALGDCDVMLSALFTHHLTKSEITRFLRAMEQRSRIGWFVNDLHRHAVAYHGFRLLACLARWHRFVQHDGPISVARGFRRDDWVELLDDARLADVAEIRWWLPFRYTVARLK